jgi:hypothetical protein
MSDLDVAKEYLQHEYPSFTPSEIDEELKRFIPNDSDLEEDISFKQRELKKYAIKGKNVLGDLVSKFDEPVEIKYPKEVQEDLTLAQNYKKQAQLNQTLQKEYDDKIKNISSNLQKLELRLNDDSTLDFNISEDIKKSLPESINSMPHWVNQDGTWNHESIVKDAVKVLNFDSIVQAAYKQGLSVGKNDVIKDASNITLEQPSPKPQTEKKGSKIEGWDDFMGSKKLQIRK